MNKKLLLHLFLATVFLGHVQAQILLDQDTVITSSGDDLEMVGYNNFAHDSDETRTFRWTRNEVYMAEGWKSAVCDKNACWNSIVGTESYDLHPDSISRLDVHVYFNGNYEGEALIEILVEDVNEPTTNVNAVYIFNTSFTSTKEARKLDFKVYPNPSTGLFTVENTKGQAAVLEIFSTSGRLMHRFNVAEGNWYDIAELNAGTYLVTLRGEGGEALGTKLISKF